MSLRITSVYTKTGDDGGTALVGGQRVRKHHPRIESYGTVDELMAVLGVARVEFDTEHKRINNASRSADFASLLEYLQNRLFTLGGQLATREEDMHPKMPRIVEDDIAFLERVCDAYNAGLEPLKDFVLPGGARTAAALHVARTVARRAERHLVALAEQETVDPLCAKFLNRLSDALFIVSRWVNKEMGCYEVIWRQQLAAPPLPELDEE
ncbi:MAG: cob(I)yrinic acid a,c-diamide adenosyltransferase [Candidatus Sumerlaeia bacterium]|nr:cob(I)yrinic acid a,c-diamide adenosyltransferase [Candidatus Sumerlaeia bacterium]